jgi:hypothetical protein
MDRFVNIIDGWPSPPQPTKVGMQYQDFVKTASFLGYQATKQPRTTTPNTSSKMPTNSLQITAVNPIKNHIAEQPDDESQEFALERVVPTTQESMSWNQVTAIIPARQSFQSITVTTKQGDYQATKQPRTITPNTSRKMPTNSLQITAVNPIKNHIAEQPDDESQDFAPERVVPMSWNQVTIFVWLAKQWLTHPASFRKIAST